MSDLYDANSERELLAAALTSPERAAKLDLPSEAFFVPPYRTIAEAMIRMVAAGDVVDPSTIMAPAAALAGGGRASERVREALIEMVGSVASPAAMPHHSGRVLELWRARRLAEIGEQMLLSVHEEGSLEFLDEIARRAQEGIADQGAVNMTGQEPTRLSELSEVDTNYDWLVPDLLEATDRLLITGEEGLGKSMLCAQFAITLAAGLHPFLGIPINGPKSVLVVDAENSRRQVTRRYEALAEQMNRQRSDLGLGPNDWDTQLGFLLQPEGLFLNEPNAHRLLENMIVTQKPDVVVAGPLYRLHTSDTKDEQAAKELVNAIDQLRVKYHFAFICETHTNHGSPGQNRPLRPTGSSVFMRWPEFGVGLRRTPETEGEDRPREVLVKHWRGGRDERLWPKRLAWGMTLPWRPSDDDYYTHNANSGRI